MFYYFLVFGVCVVADRSGGQAKRTFFGGGLGGLRDDAPEAANAPVLDAEGNEVTTEAWDKEESGVSNQDIHSTVALLDIVFSDSSKRTCSGAIIHDFVVLSVAHCFTLGKVNDVEPELTISFVVIGDKKMFDTGYEQYLPMERILIHPSFTGGWTADIALVFTYAGMTSEKPGTIIPLIGDNMLNIIDSNITVLSWGQCEQEEVSDKGDIPTASAEALMISGVKHLTRNHAKRKDDSRRRIQDWRRRIGSLQNRLTIENFGFVNTQACKRFIDRVMSREFHIENEKEVLCFTSDEHYVTSDDSGAPVLKNGRLLALTLGDAECEQDHIGIALRVSCYCTWIAANLPDRNFRSKCCDNCCAPNSNAQSLLKKRLRKRF